MNWFRVPKELTAYPVKGKYYSDWKEDLLLEGCGQCVYCTININSFGGVRNFHIEHYRPKAKDKFPNLEHDFSNLFFACSICNCFKSDDWPNEPSSKLDNNAFPDPSKISYADFLVQDEKHLIKSGFITGEYLIQKLFLNRPQLILERKCYILHQELKKETEKLKIITQAIKEQENENPIIDALIIMINTNYILISEKYVNPYTSLQIKR